MSQMNPFMYSGVSPVASQGLSELLALQNQGGVGGGGVQPNTMTPPPVTPDPLQMMEGAQKIDYRFRERSARQDQERAMQMERLKQSGNQALLGQEQAGRMALLGQEQAGAMAMEKEQQAGRMAQAEFESKTIKEMADSQYQKQLKREMMELKAQLATGPEREALLAEMAAIEQEEFDTQVKLNQAMADYDAQVKDPNTGSLTLVRRKLNGLNQQIEVHEAQQNVFSPAATAVAPGVVLNMRTRSGSGESTRSFGSFIVNEGIGRFIEGTMEQMGIGDPTVSAMEIQSRLESGELSPDMLFAGVDANPEMGNITPENVARARRALTSDMFQEMVQRTFLASGTPINNVEFGEALTPIVRALSGLHSSGSTDPLEVEKQVAPLVENLAVAMYGPDNAKGRLPEVYMILDLAVGALSKQLLDGPVAEAAQLGQQIDVSAIQTRALASAAPVLAAFNAYLRTASRSQPTFDKMLKARSTLQTILDAKDAGPEEMLAMVEGAPLPGNFDDLVSSFRTAVPLAQRIKELQREETDVKLKGTRAKQRSERVVGDAEATRNKALLAELEKEIAKTMRGR